MSHQILFCGGNYQKSVIFHLYYYIAESTNKRAGMLKQGYTEDIESSMKKLFDTLSEKDQRRYAAVEAKKLGNGGQQYICKLFGCDPKTVKRGNEELQGEISSNERIRQPGGGRKKIIDTIENIDAIFLEILREHTAGSPMDEKIKWTNLTQREISEAFAQQGMNVTEHVVQQLLEKHKYVKRKMQKMRTMKETRNRNEQFEKIQCLKEEYQTSENPIISIDVKKKEMIGDFCRDGEVYCTEIQEKNDHDFKSFADGVVIPHGIYDLKRNEGYMTLGNSRDTSEFCCACLKGWWLKDGRIHYPNASSILILADGGGSNSSRHYLFKEDLQKLVDEIGIEIRMAHYPPYTSKYNPIEHRLFCHVTRACKGVAFNSIEIVNELMSKTSTLKGLKVFSSIMDEVFEKGRKYSEGFKENMQIIFDDFLSQWNYRVVPSAKI
jgi:hypothetical protein